MVENRKIGFPIIFYRFTFFRKINRLLLAFFMVLGLLCGMLAAVDLNPFVLSLMRTAPFCGVSIVGFFALLFLPFMLSAIAVFLSSNWLLITVCFIKFFSFAYSAKATLFAYGDAGWLVRWLLMFSSALLLPVLIWFCMIHIDGIRRDRLLIDAACCAVLVLVIGSLDYHVLSPFLVKIIK